MPAFPIREPDRLKGRWPPGDEFDYQMLSEVVANEIQYGRLQLFDGPFTSVAIRPHLVGAVDTLVRVGVYSDAGGEPGSKLGEGSLTLDAASHDDQLVDVPLDAPVALSGPDIVWLAFVSATALSVATFVSTDILVPPFHDVRFELGDGTLPSVANPDLSIAGSLIYTAIKE